MRILVFTFLMIVTACSDPLNLAVNASHDDKSNFGKPEDRPSDDSEGVPGYLTELSLITFKKLGNLLEVRGYQGSIKISDNFTNFFINILQIPKEGFYEASSKLEKVDAAIASSNMSDREYQQDTDKDEIQKQPQQSDIGPTSNQDDPNSSENDGNASSNSNASGDDGHGGDDGADNNNDGQGLLISESAHLTSVRMDGILRDSVRPNLDGSFRSTFEIDLDNNDPFVIVIGELKANNFVNIFASSNDKIDRVFFNPYSKKIDKVSLDAEFIRQVPVNQDISEAIEANAVEGQPSRFDEAEYEPMVSMNNQNAPQEAPRDNQIEPTRIHERPNDPGPDKPTESGANRDNNTDDSK